MSPDPQDDARSRDGRTPDGDPGSGREVESAGGDPGIESSAGAEAGEAEEIDGENGPRAEAWTDVLGVGDEGADGPGPKIFQHPEWTVGLVLVFAVVSLLLALANPLFLIIGSPFILVLALWVGVRLYERLKAEAGQGRPEGP